MTRQERTNTSRTRKLRARADRLCMRSNQLRVRADKLFDRAEAAASEAKDLLAKVDELYAEANALHGNVVRRQCLKCSGAFGSKGFGNRLCADCNAQNAALRESPTSAPKWNGQPMSDGRVKL